MRPRSDKAIAEEIANKPGTKHLTPEQLQILIAETLQLVKADRAAFQLRRKPPKPAREKKPPRDWRPIQKAIRDSLFLSKSVHASPEA